MGTTGANTINHASYQHFIARFSGDLARIARQTRGEHTAEDIQGEIWITAYDLQAKKGIEVNFNDPEHQQLILSFTYQRLVEYTEKRLRYASSLDHSAYEDDTFGPLDRIAGEAKTDPVDQLQRKEQEARDQEALAAQGMSVAAAWLLVWDRCGRRMVHVARFLRISRSHAYRCYDKVQNLVRVQTVLGLGMEGEAYRQVAPWRPFRLYREPEQLWFDFDPELELD
ncbi:hypothetical protein [Alloalcanivorax xenomutans]|uniref:hypothetical protein n=1 Tax=Alloalcanivorax xenomutans TaxID=1094342 RepID=UPI001F40A4D0|nr:hypothetical protein [Alloalcanivorax xenomutans]MCE7525661.1 hypothetical protein [Alloalcanivorax xenomutans]